MSESRKLGRSSLDRIREIVGQMETMSEQVQAASGRAEALRESRSVIKAFEERQEEMERAAWREAARQAALNMLPLMPELNVNSWEENIGEPATWPQKFLANSGLGKALRPKMRVYPLAYLKNHMASLENRYRSGVIPKELKDDIYSLGKTTLLVIDEQGRLWKKEAWVLINRANRFDSPHLLTTSLDMARTLEEVEEQYDDKEKARQAYLKQTGTLPPRTGAVMAIEPHGIGELTPWEADGEFSMSKAGYEVLTHKIKGLLASHQNWMELQSKKIAEAHIKAESPELKALVPVLGKLTR